MDGKNAEERIENCSWLYKTKEVQTRLHNTMLLLYNYPSLPLVDEWWVDLWWAHTVFALAMTSDTKPLANSSSLSLPCINKYKSQLDY